MSEVRETERNTLVGVGVGVAAAGLATVAGLAVDRLWRDREHAVALGAEEDFTVQPSENLVVVADDGVPLHVEVDEPEEAAPTRPTVVLSHGYTLDLRSWVYQRRALREAGYRVGIVANQPHGIVEQLEALDLRLDVIASSASLGVAKPDPAFFARIVELCDAPAATIAYVGDRIDNDILPAQAAGMRAVFIRRGPWGYIQARWPEAAQARHRIDSLAELPPLLAALDTAG